MQSGKWRQENYKKISEMLDGPPGLAAFDFDNTLIYNDLGEACMYYIALQALIRADTREFWTEIRHPVLAEEHITRLRRDWEELSTAADENPEAALRFADGLIQCYARIEGQIGLEAAYRWTRVFFGGQSEKELRTIAKYVLDYEMEREIGEVELPSGLKMNTGIRVYSEIKDLIAQMLKRGWRVRIITASPQPIIQAVISHWGLPEEAVGGMRLARDGDQLLPTIEEPMTFGSGKIAMLKLTDDGALPFRFAAGDSWTDFNMLLHAENAVLIDRGDPHLISRAMQSGFWIQDRFI